MSYDLSGPRGGCLDVDGRPRRSLSQKSHDDPFLVFASSAGRRSYSWGELWALVAIYRDKIQQTLPSARFLLVIGGTTPFTIASFLGGIAAGRVMSIFPPEHWRQDRAYYRKQQVEALAKVGADGIIAYGDAADRLRESGTQIPVISLDEMDVGELTKAGRDAATAVLCDFIQRIEDSSADAEPLFIQHSSGTTGIKKAVAVRAELLRAQFSSYWCGVVERDVGRAAAVASWLPLYHDMGLLASLLLPTLAGSRIAFVDPFEWVARPQLFFDLIAEEHANICWMPNFAFRHYCRLAPVLRPADLSSMRAWVDCSEPCRTRDAHAFERRFESWGVGPGSVVGCYAMAETVFAVSQARVGTRKTLNPPPDIREGDVIPRSCVETRLSPSDASGANGGILSSGPLVPEVRASCFVGGRAVENGTYGEIGVLAPFRFDRYLPMTPAESGIRLDGYYMTGDLGVILDDELFVFGRTKEIIIVNGKNLFATDIEGALSGVLGIKPGRLVAFGIESTNTGSEELVIVAERERHSARAETDIAAEMSQILASLFLVTPKDVAVVGERWLVKSTSGKISRNENRRKYLDLRSSQGSSR